MKLFEESNRTYAKFAEAHKGYGDYEYYQRKIREENSGNWKFNEEKDEWMSKSRWEADAWARCMRK
jgi:hypothetical protein